MFGIGLGLGLGLVWIGLDLGEFGEDLGFVFDRYGFCSGDSFAAREFILLEKMQVLTGIPSREL